MSSSVSAVRTALRPLLQAMQQPAQCCTRSSVNLPHRDLAWQPHHCRSVQDFPQHRPAVVRLLVRPRRPAALSPACCRDLLLMQAPHLLSATSPWGDSSSSLRQILRRNQACSMTRERLLHPRPQVALSAKRSLADSLTARQGCSARGSKVYATMSCETRYQHMPNRVHIRCSSSRNRAIQAKAHLLCGFYLKIHRDHSRHLRRLRCRRRRLSGRPWDRGLRTCLRDSRRTLPMGITTCSSRSIYSPQLCSHLPQCRRKRIRPRRRSRTQRRRRRSRKRIHRRLGSPALTYRRKRVQSRLRSRPLHRIICSLRHLVMHATLKKGERDTVHRDPRWLHATETTNGLLQRFWRAARL